MQEEKAGQTIMNVYTQKIRAKAVLAGHMAGVTGIGAAQILLSVLFGFGAWFLRRTSSDLRGTVLCAAGECLLLALSVWLQSALRQGKLAWHICRSVGRQPSGTQILFWMRYARSVKSRCLYAVVRVRKTAWLLLLNSPCAALLGAWYYAQNTGQLQTLPSRIVLGGAVVCGLTGVVFTMLLNQQYAAAAYLLAVDPSLSVRQSVRESRRRMAESCGKMMLFKLSFLPWFLSCVLLIPLIYVIPYYQQGCVCMLQKILSGSSCGSLPSESIRARRVPPRQ